MCILLLLIPRLLIYFSDPPDILMTTEQIHRFQDRSVPASPSKKQAKKSKKQYFAPPTRFDPNKYELSEWMALGLSKKQSQGVLNFIKRGISSNRSLEKIYVLPKRVYELIKDSTYYEKKEIIYTSDHIQESKESVTLLEINSASKDDLIALNGIGEFYAKQIVRYRDELGGFSFKEQLLEVWKMRLETYEKVLPQIYFDSVKIKQINVNECSIEILKSHPYLDYYQANSIVKMRIQKGSFMELDELLESKLIDEEEYKRILPYVRLK